MSWSIGSIIVAGASYSYNNRLDHWAWKVPLALQWIFPVSNQELVYLPKLGPELTRPDTSIDLDLLRP